MSQSSVAETPHRPELTPPRVLGIVGLIKRAPHYLRLLLGMVGDRRVSLFDRILVVASVVYVVFPLDLVPDFIPVLGQVDDLVLVITTVSRLFDRAPREVIESHWKGPAGELDPGALRKLIYFASLFATPGRRRRLRRALRGA
jgi:uncharacterized membrane protein YkvA (DUF1232 family)